MVIHIYLSFYIITNCSYFYVLKYYSKSSKDIHGLSSLTLECIWSPSTDSESALSPVASNDLLSVLSLGLCHCLCSGLALLVSLALLFPNLTHV